MTWNLNAGKKTMRYLLEKIPVIMKLLDPCLESFLFSALSPFYIVIIPFQQEWNAIPCMPIRNMRSAWVPILGERWVLLGLAGYDCVKIGVVR